jgi:hypothetical protein
MSNEVLEQIPLWVRVPTGVAFSDVPQREPGRLPEFIVIGAAKAGTTALHHYLDLHPQIHMCPLKEPHFFSTDLIYQRGLEWYKGLYADAQPGQICGEASTSYSFWANTAITAKRIYDALPGVKLIYIVREPIARAEAECLQVLKYSQFVLKDNSLPRSVDALLDYLQAENNSLAMQPIRTGEYITQIEHYLQWFGRDQLLVLFHSDLRDRPQQVLSTVFKFLEVEDIQLDLKLLQNHNITADFVRGLKSEALRNSLQRFPGYELAKALVPPVIKRRIQSFALKQMQNDQIITPLSNQTRRSLSEHFQPFNESLANFLNCDLSHWQLK